MKRRFSLFCTVLVLVLAAGAALAAEPKIEVKTSFLVIEGNVTDEMIAQARKESEEKGNRPSKSEIWVSDVDDAGLQRICKAFSDHTGIKLTDSDGVTSLAPLAEMKGLLKVNLTDLPNVKDISILSSFPNITFLTVRKIPHAEEDLKVIAEMEDLMWLDFSYLPKGFKGLAGIENKTQLKTLYLSYSTLPDLTPLTTLPSLEKVNFDNAKGGDLTPLAGIASLKEISVKKSVFPQEQLKALADAGKTVKQ